MINSYLLFHSLAELFSVVIAFTIFVLAWKSRRFLNNGYLMFIGIAFLFVGGIDLVHTLAYKGMGVFPTNDANLPTQLWVAARYLQAFSLLLAPAFLKRTFKPKLALAVFSGIFALLLAAIFSGHFPTSYVEGVGLTPFKRISEYLISIILVISLVILLRNREAFIESALRWLALSITASVISELAFSDYANVYGFANFVGHIFKIIAFYFIFLAIVETGIERPYDFLFRNLRKSEAALRHAYDELEQRVVERTLELQQVNQDLAETNKLLYQTNAELLNEIAKRQSAQKERDRVTQELETQNALFETVLQQAADGVIVCDPQGNLTLVNQAARRISGLKGESDFHLDPAELGEAFDAGGNPIPLENWSLSKALHGETSVGQEERMRRPDGSYYDILISAAPVLSSDGVLLGAVSTFADITQRKQAEEALQEAKAELEAKVTERTSALQRANEGLVQANRRLETVLQSLPVGVWIANAEGLIVEKNALADQLLPVDQPQAYTAYWPESGEELKPEDWPLTRALSNGSVTLSEMVDLSHKDGRTRSILNSAAPFYNEQGNLLGAVAVAEDLTHQRQVERKAQEAAAELDAVFSSISDAVIVYNQYGQPILANPAAQRAYGFNPTQYDQVTVARKINFRKSDSDQVDVKDLPVTHALQGQQAYSERYKFTNAQGFEQTVLVSASPLCIDGDQSGAVVVWSDITQREELLAENQRQRDLLQTIFEIAPVGLAVLTGEELDYQWVNPAYRSFLPHPEIEPAGHTYDEIWPPREGFEQHNIFHHTLDTGEPLRFERDKRLYPDGSLHYFSVQARRIDWNGQPAVLSVTWETTELEEARRRAEQSAREARRRAAEAEEGRRTLEAIMDAVPTAVWISHDPEGKHITGNPASYRLLRLPPGSNIPISLLNSERPGYFRMVRNGEEIPNDQLPLRIAASSGHEVKDYEADLIFKDGVTRHIFGNANPLFNKDGNLAGSVAVFVDITDLQEAEKAIQNYAAQLERSNRDLQDFAFVASHDLQEPLRKIEAFGDRLKVRVGNRLTPEEQDYVSRMIDAAHRMKGMINDLLAYSRVTTKAQPFKQVDLAKVTREVLSDLEVSIERSQAQVLVGDLPTIEADELQMRQLLQNLIGNALKFHRKGVPPVVNVNARHLSNSRKTTSQVELSISDNGIGFDEKYAERILQPFQRLHGRNEYEGSGIGLAICRKIVERHKGEILVHSQPGKGAQFTITLPREHPKDD